MNGSPAFGDVLFYGLLLLLPLSALIARRLPLGQVARMAMAWTAIFALGLLIATQRDRLRDLITREPEVAGISVRLPVAQDGHFWADARINGVQRRMLVDTGASTTVLSTTTARLAGIDAEVSTFPRIVSTANGQVIARSATVARFAAGGIEEVDLPVLVLEGNVDVIGMNFLDRLAGWQVENGILTLTD